MANKLIKSMTQALSKAFRVDVGRDAPMPRKGLWSFSNAVLNKKQLKSTPLNPFTLKRLANTDPITWAIRRVIKGFISQTKWDIVPDTQPTELELDRWEDSILDSLNPYDIDNSVNFTSEIMNTNLQAELKAKSQTIIDDIYIDSTEKRERIRWLFRTYTKKIRQEAESHKHKVKCIFEHPNHTDSSFRQLLELILDDILIYDAGIIIKNYDWHNRLAELYTIPGHEVYTYRNEDRTMPEPPDAAYVWEEAGIQRAEFTNDELVYIMQNPQHTGYGQSPLEVAAYIITASLYADEYNIDYFKNSNVPPGIVNLGPDVTEDQRALFQKMWELETQGRGGLHKLVITSGSDKLQFVPMRNMSNQDMQMMEYLKWAASIKCSCYGLSPQDIGFVLDFGRPGGETQESLSQRRGIKSLLNLTQSYFNEEIVKSEFPFKDVKFEWESDDKKSDIQEVQMDKIDIDTGVISRNERRKKLGLKPIDGGDKYIISSTGNMVPVEDLERMDDPVEPGVLPQQPGLPIAQQSDSPLTGLPGAAPGPVSEPKVDGEPGRPTLHEEATGSNIDVSVNPKQSTKKQIDNLNNAVAELKKKGINATLRIGFGDDVEKNN
jgi:HK97 family phage portal protein